MGFKNRVRKRLAKLRRLCNKNQPTQEEVSDACGCTALNQDIQEAKRKLEETSVEVSQQLDIAERQLQLLVIELKEQLLPSRCKVNNKLSEQLNELYHDITDASSPVDLRSKSPEAITDEAHSLSNTDTGISRDEEAHINRDHENTMDIDQNKEWGAGGEHLDKVATTMQSDGIHHNDIIIQDNSKPLDKYPEEENHNLRHPACAKEYQGHQEHEMLEENVDQLIECDSSLNPDEGGLHSTEGYQSDTLCRSTCDKDELEDQYTTMERARLAFESVTDCNSTANQSNLLGQTPIALTGAGLDSTEPPWTVPAPKPPSLFPNIDRCWLDEDINHNDPIEVYMHYQGISWTAPRQGGPTTAMIQAGRMQQNPPADFFVEELN